MTQYRKNRKSGIPKGTVRGMSKNNTLYSKYYDKQGRRKE